MPYAANNPNSEMLVKAPGWAEPPFCQWGTRTLLTSGGVSLVKTNEGVSPKNISFLKQMSPLDQSADESVLFKRFLEGTQLY